MSSLDFSSEYSMILKKCKLFLGRHFPYLPLSTSMPFCFCSPFGPFPLKHLREGQGPKWAEVYWPKAPAQLPCGKCLGQATHPTSVTQSQDTEGTWPTKGHQWDSRWPRGPAGPPPVLTEQPRVGEPPGVVVGGILWVAVGAPRKLTPCTW